VATALAAPCRASAVGFLEQWGGSGASAGQVNAVGGVAVDRSPFVYVLDSGNRRIDKFAGAGGFLSTWGFGVDDGATGALQSCVSGCAAGVSGTGAGQLANDANGIAVTPGTADPSVYVADSSNDRIVKYSADGVGTTPTSFGSSGTGEGSMDNPTGVAVSPLNGHVYVVDQGNRRVNEFDGNGGFVAAWGKDVGGTGVDSCTALCQTGQPGTGDGEFTTPVDVAVNSFGEVYVTDSARNDVQRFDKDGAFLGSWGGAGSEIDRLDAPTGIAISTADNVYVADTVNNRVTVFSRYGSPNFTFGWGVNGHDYSETCSSSCLRGVAGVAYGQLTLPNRLAVDAGGNVYVSDAGNNRIQKFGEVAGHIASNGQELQDLVGSVEPYGTILLQPGTYDLPGALEITGKLSIVPYAYGGGDARTIVIDAGRLGRVFDVRGSGANVSLAGMTITGGFVEGQGGGLLAEPSTFAYLSNAAVRGNETRDGGGDPSGAGIANEGELHAANVTVSGNTARSGTSFAARGGGIFTSSAGVAETFLVNTTISGNAVLGSALSGGFGGGLATDSGGATTASSSTIAGNTVTGALAGQGGGNVWSAGTGTTALTNSIVAGGSSNMPGTENCAPGRAQQLSNGGNLEDRDQCNFHRASDQHSRAAALRPLANNGGPVDTRSIAPDSPARNRALGGQCDVFDARGFPRKTAATGPCDIGAFELQASELPDPKPTCVLRLASTKVRVPVPAALILRASCDQSTSMRLTGRLVMAPRKRRGAKRKPKARVYAFALGPKSGRPHAAVLFTLAVPKSALKLLGAGARASASCSLRALGATGAATATAGPARITLLKAKKAKH
jgi:NHL repeat